MVSHGTHVHDTHVTHGTHHSHVDGTHDSHEDGKQYYCSHCYACPVLMVALSLQYCLLYRVEKYAMQIV